MNTQVVNHAKLPAVVQGNIGEAEIQTVNARDLHKFLGSKRQFADWIKERITQYDFQENQDYLLVSQNNEIKGRGGDRRSIDYFLSLDMAKELCMVERNERGKQARAYFIDCERRLKTISPRIDFSDPAIMLGAFEHLYLENKRKDIIIEEQGEQIKIQDAVLDNIARVKGSILPTAAAKTISIKPRRFFQFCSGSKWFYKHKSSNNWLGFQDKIDAGYLEHKITDYRDRYGNKKAVSQVRVTPKGLLKLAELFAQPQPQPQQQIH